MMGPVEQPRSYISIDSPSLKGIRPADVARSRRRGVAVAPVPDDAALDYQYVTTLGYQYVTTLGGVIP
jgi:hypothetical protein